MTVQYNDLTGYQRRFVVEALTIAYGARGTGKTTAALHAALSGIEQGKRVLLLAANHRQGSKMGRDLLTLAGRPPYRHESHTATTTLFPSDPRRRSVIAYYPPNIYDVLGGQRYDLLVVDEVQLLPTQSLDSFVYGFPQVKVVGEPNRYPWSRLNRLHYDLKGETWLAQDAPHLQPEYIRDLKHALSEEEYYYSMKCKYPKPWLESDEGLTAKKKKGTGGLKIGDVVSLPQMYGQKVNTEGVTTYSKIYKGDYEVENIEQRYYIVYSKELGKQAYLPRDAGLFFDGEPIGWEDFKVED